MNDISRLLSDPRTRTDWFRANLKYIEVEKFDFGRYVMFINMKLRDDLPSSISMSWITIYDWRMWDTFVEASESEIAAFFPNEHIEFDHNPIEHTVTIYREQRIAEVLSL